MADEKDSLICELFANLSILGDLRKSYDQSVTEGYIQLSKSRLNEGMSFGSLQYPNTMTPLVGIESMEGQFNLIKLTQQETITTDNNLRQRNLKSKVNTSIGEANKQTLLHTNDPIRWFSGLPPQSLRMSQLQFKKSIEILVGIANTYRQMKILMEKIASLSKDVQTLTHDDNN